MPKTTVSIDLELKEEMEKYKDKLNFSEIFRRAVKKSISKLIGDCDLKNEFKINYTDIIDRFKSEKGEGAYDKGRIAGIKWAAFDAEFYEISEERMRELRGEEEFETEVNIEKELEKEWLSGWLDGAKEIWNEIKDKI